MLVDGESEKKSMNNLTHANVYNYNRSTHVCK